MGNFKIFVLMFSTQKQGVIKSIRSKIMACLIFYLLCTEKTIDFWSLGSLFFQNSLAYLQESKFSIILNFKSNDGSCEPVAEVHPFAIGVCLQFSSRLCAI